MKKLLAITSVLALLSTAAIAAETPADHMAGGEGKAAMKTEKFDDVKANRLAKISEHMDELKKRESCVQAAKDFEALKACYPKHGERMEKMKDHMKDGATGQ